MTKKEFDVLVLDEQRKWGPGGTGTLLFESKGEVKLPHSEGKTEPEKKDDPLAKITPEMYAKLAYGTAYVALPANIHSLSEAKDKLPDGIHQKMAETFGGTTTGLLANYNDEGGKQNG